MSKSPGIDRKTITLFKATLLTASLIPAAAIAQDGQDGVSAPDQTSSSGTNSMRIGDPIIVTARRAEELLSEIPISITALGSENIEKLDINNLDDLTNFTPGLELTKWSQAGGYKLSIRGLYSDRGRSSVALRIDGIDSSAESIYNIGLAYLPNQRLMDLERIEVVKGSQVALYGRAAYGGAINYITKRPSLSGWNGSVNVSASSEREYEGNIKFNGPIVPDKLSLGITAAYWDDGGSYKNQLTDERVGQETGKGIAAALYFEPDDRITNYTRFEYSDTETSMGPGVISGPNSVFTFDENAAAVLGADSTPYFSGVAPSRREEDIEIMIDPRTGSNFPGLDSEVFTATNIFEIDFGGIGFKSLTGYIDLKNRNYQNTIYQPQPYVNADGTLNTDGDGVVPTIWTSQAIITNTDTTIFNQELQLFSNDDSRLQWQIGGQYWLEDLKQFQTQPTPVPIGPVPSADVINFILNGLEVYDAHFERKVEHWSGYLWAEYELTDTLSISLEGRYSSEDITYLAEGRADVSLAIPGENGAPTEFVRVTPITPLQIDTLKSSYFIPKGTITYKPNEQFTFYASVAKSTQPPGYDTFNGVLNEFSFFSEETLWTYEGGVKGRVADGVLGFDAAFFYQDYSGEQVATVIVDQESDLPTAATENAGKSRRYGLDLAVDIRATDNLLFRGSYLYLNTKFTDYEFWTQSPISASQGPCVRIESRGAADGCIISLAGNQAGQAPKHQFSIYANYSGTIAGPGYDYFIEPNVRYKGKRFLNSSNNEIAPSYWRVDVRAGVEIGNFDVSAFVTNVFDSKTSIDHVSFFDYQDNFLPADLQFLPDPRTFGVKLGYSF